MSVHPSLGAKVSAVCGRAIMQRLCLHVFDTSRCCGRSCKTELCKGNSRNSMTGVHRLRHEEQQLRSVRKGSVLKLQLYLWLILLMQTKSSTHQCEHASNSLLSFPSSFLQNKCLWPLLNHKRTWQPCCILHPNQLISRATPLHHPLWTPYAWGPGKSTIGKVDLSGPKTFCWAPQSIVLPSLQAHRLSRTKSFEENQEFRWAAGKAPVVIPPFGCMKLWSSCCRLSATNIQ